MSSFYLEVDKLENFYSSSHFILCKEMPVKMKICTPIVETKDSTQLNSKSAIEYDSELFPSIFYPYNLSS